MAGLPQPERWRMSRGAGAPPVGSPSPSPGALPLLDEPSHPPAAPGAALSRRPGAGGTGGVGLPSLEEATGRPSPQARAQRSAPVSPGEPTGPAGPRDARPGASAPSAGPSVVRAAARAPAQRRRTRAQPAGMILTVLAVLLLGWGTHALLTSVHIVAHLLSGAPLFSRAAAMVIAGGALTALCAVICSVIAVVRARPRAVAASLLVGSLILPAGAAVTGLSLGAAALKAQTLAEASAAAGRIDPAAVEALLTRAQGLGIEVPWSEELLDILRQAEQSLPDPERTEQEAG